MDETQKLKMLVEKLVALGEDKGELGFWQDIFDELNAEERQKLFRNLEDELKELEATK